MRYPHEKSTVSVSMCKRGLVHRAGEYAWGNTLRIPRRANTLIRVSRHGVSTELLAINAKRLM